MTPEYKQDLKAYGFGFVGALVLTALAFAAVWAGLPRTLALWVIGALAIVQAFWQMRHFLHLSLRETPKDRLWLVAFALLVLALMVLGTLWVLFNLQHMVPMQMPE